MKKIRRLVVPTLASLALAAAAIAPLQATADDQPGSAPRPGSQQATKPLDLVVFNDTQKDFFLDNPQWVHPGDRFMVVSANAFGGDNEDYDPTWVNDTARQLLTQFPDAKVLATTSGRRNTRTALRTVDRDFIDIVMTVWEPRNPDFPTEAFNNRDRETVNRVTRDFAREMTDLAHAQNPPLKYWMKPTGRSTIGRDHEGELSYRDIITIADGMNVQTQGSCVNDTYPRAVDGLVRNYKETGSLDKGLFVQISLGGSGPNQVTPEEAFACARQGWDRAPAVDAVTMWWASSKPDQARTFLKLREDLLDNNDPNPPNAAPYPPSTTIKSMKWEQSTHESAAAGSDLWPTTWGPDDRTYTAWGDGNGFQGSTKRSYGLASIDGGPKASGTDLGEGPRGSGHGKIGALLYVDDALYSLFNTQTRPHPNWNQRIQRWEGGGTDGPPHAGSGAATTGASGRQPSSISAGTTTARSTRTCT